MSLVFLVSSALTHIHHNSTELQPCLRYCGTQTQRHSSNIHILSTAQTQPKEPVTALPNQTHTREVSSISQKRATADFM